MNPFNPYDYVSLDGFGIMRGVTLALPSGQVSGVLPPGVVLGAQSVTPPGTHPVIVLFNRILGAHMSVPTLLPSLTYHELSVGVPFCYVTGTDTVRPGQGPFYFQPRLYLDSVLATAGGVFYWGFAKSMASFEVSEDAYVVRSTEGEVLSTLEVQSRGAFRCIADMPAFGAVRRMHDQPLLSTLPLGMGPLPVCSSFDKNWDAGTIAPLETVARIGDALVPGLHVGRVPASGFSTGIDGSVLGAYEMRLPWRLSMPYPPPASSLMQRTI